MSKKVCSKLGRRSSVYAVIKTSGIIIGKYIESAKLSARNILAGEVTRLERGVVNSEVEIILPGGAAVVASITKASVAALGLNEGDKVSAIIKASNVVIGVE
jgi:molybdate transport system regulatory protein